ncbi:MAG TPA: alpha/beta fold hydrolase, partial [Roseiflexaceae bacterium]|nr:alpha/beta fold hydrolase [Roseiflexaceae bacterium]
TPAPTPAPTPASYEPADCRFDQPPDAQVECGYLSVPERRDRPDSRTIRLHVAVFKSTAADPAPDPVVYLEGGPGGDALKSVALGFEERVAPFLERGDFVVFDQRGTGFSEPALDCPELSDLNYELLDDDLTIAESTERYVATTLACRQRLGQQAIDFGAYNSVESAADVRDLRMALGYDEWNLYGISYGTRLALTTLREHPEGIRSAILDSTVPLQSGEAETPANIARAFTTLFDGCAADPGCQAAFPDLEGAFYRLVDRLNESPVTEPVVDPLSGQRYSLLLNGDSLFGVLAQALYSSDLIPLLPLAIRAGEQGVDYSLLARLAMIGTIQGEFVSEGMFYSVRCHEEIAFTTPAELAAADDPFPELGGAFDQSVYVEICSRWDAGAAEPVENQPVTSDIPALVLAGEYDPATPPEDGRIAARTLSNSFFFEFPGLGHGVSVDGPCPQSITLAFLENPGVEPDASCIAGLKGPAFVLPDARVDLVPFEDERAGIRGVRPEGWSERSPGVYTRPSGDVALIQMRLPVAPGAVAQTMLRQLGVGEVPKPSETYEANGHSWTIYRLDDVRGQPVEMGVAEEGSGSLLVMLASSGPERESLYEKVFLPALEALEPIA